MASNRVFYVASKVIEPLAEMSYDGSGLVPRLATDWGGSADGRSVTLKLRPSLTWHDGKPFISVSSAPRPLVLRGTPIGARSVLLQRAQRRRSAFLTQVPGLAGHRPPSAG